MAADGYWDNTAEGYEITDGAGTAAAGDYDTLHHTPLKTRSTALDPGNQDGGYDGAYLIRCRRLAAGPGQPDVARLAPGPRQPTRPGVCR